MARALNLYLRMIFEAGERGGPKVAEKITEWVAEKLTPPADWRDPETGLPAGWTNREEDEWALWERQMGRSRK